MSMPSTINPDKMFTPLGESGNFQDYMKLNEPPFNFDSPNVFNSKNPINQGQELTGSLIIDLANAFGNMDLHNKLGNFISQADWTVACFDVAEGFMKKDIGDLGKGVIGLADNCSNILEEEKFQENLTDDLDQEMSMNMGMK